MTRRSSRHPRILALAGLALLLTMAARAQEGVPPRVRSAFQTAQESYSRGDYAGASLLFLQVQAKQSELTASEQQDLQSLMRLNNIALQSQRDGQQKLRQAEDALRRNKTQEASSLLTALNANQYLAPSDKQLLGQLQERLRTGKASEPGDAATTVKAPPPPKEKSKSWMATLTAPFYTVKSFFTGSTPPKDPPSTPDQNPPPVRRPDVAPEKPTTEIVVGPGAGARPEIVPPKNTVQGKPPSQATVEARQLLAQARQAIAGNEFAKAKQLVDQAQALRPDLQWWDETPEKLLREIRQRAPEVVPATAQIPHIEPARRDGEHPPKEKVDPRALVREGRILFRQGKFDEAEKLCASASVPAARWGLFEDSPSKLRNDIQRARARQDRAESAKLLAEARQLFKQGELEEAKALAERADRLHGPYSMWDLGDRPRNLLGDIRVAEAKMGQPHRPKDPLVKDNPKNPPPASMAHMEAKQKAQALLGEAQVLTQNGNLIGARQKLLDAEKWAVEAAKGGVQFAPNENSPDESLRRLAGICDARINALLMHVDTVAGKSNDPARFEKAGAHLDEARRLAQAFGHDQGKIEQKTAQVKQMQGLPAAREHAGLTDQQKIGMDLLEKARLELRHGQTKSARMLAEQACLPNYGVQEPAMQMLRSIDAEDNNQKVMSANRMFDEAHNALNQRDYRKAATIFATIDERMLTPDRQKRLRDIALQPEMTPGQIVQVGTQSPQPGGPGSARATDMHRGGSGAKPGGLDGVADRFRGMEEVLFQKLRDESLAEQKRAMESAKVGDHERALEVLRLYLLRLDESNLSPEGMAKLRVPVERRMQEFTKLRAQLRFEEQQRAGLLDANGQERKRNLDKEKTQNEIVNLVKQANELMKQGKFQEARVRYEQVKELDPDNLASQAGVFQAQVEIRRAKLEGIRKENARMTLNELDQDLGPYVGNIHDPVAIDKGGVERGRLRKQNDASKGFQSPLRDPVERRIEQRLSSPISFNYKDTPLHQIIEDLNGMSGINVLADDAALARAGVSLAMPLTMKVDNISMKSALNILLKKVDLTYMIKDQSLQITTEDEAKGKLKVTVYSVADLVVPVENHSLPVVSDMNYILAMHLEKRNFNYGPTPYQNPQFMPNGRDVSTSSGSQGSQHSQGANGPQSHMASARTLAPRTIEDQLITLITNTIEPSSWRDMGGKGTIQWFPLGMSFTINQTPDIQEQIVDLLNALRRLQDLEVAIEMRLVSVSEAFFERIGLDFDININNNNSRFEPQLLASSFQPPGFIQAFKPGGFFSGLTPAGTFTSDLGVPLNNSSFDFSIPPFGGFPGTLGADGGLSLGLAFLSDIQVFMFMEAAQGDRRTNIMQAPKITVFNGQTAFIQVNDNLFFLSDIAVSNINGVPVFTPNQVPFPIGVNLQVTPVVSADRRFVRLALTPFLTSITSATVPLLPFQVTVPQTFEQGAQPPGQDHLFQFFLQQPQPSTISLSTTVVIPDGGTVLLGGLKTLAEARNEFGPPILSKIPYINRLFRNVGYGREAQSLMIMVTARIIINEEEEQIYLGRLDPIPRP
jgi:type II secretory pathway component GspD/PulD (secretin)/tetratricopeptide (TPR) repeat protein